VVHDYQGLRENRGLV